MNINFMKIVSIVKISDARRIVKYPRDYTANVYTTERGLAANHDSCISVQHASIPCKSLVLQVTHTHALCSVSRNS